MQIRFEPYVLQKFDDWYQFPSKDRSSNKDLICQDFQLDMACLQRSHQQSLQDIQQRHQEMMAEMKYELMENLLASEQHD